MAIQELRDNVGSVRVALNGTKVNNGQADIYTYYDYYPYGSIAQSGGQSYRYDYQGAYAEKDPVTGYNNFELRMYDARIGRWLSTDPKHQYASPYEAMGNNPVMIDDPTGGCGGVGEAPCPVKPPPSNQGYGATFYNQLQNYNFGDEVTNNWNRYLDHPLELGKDLLGGLGNTINSIGSLFFYDTWKATYDNTVNYIKASPADKARADAKAFTSMLTGFGTFAPISEFGGGAMSSGKIAYSNFSQTFGKNLFLSNQFGITSEMFGSSVAKSQGFLNKPGRLFKMGWSNVMDNGGGMQFRIGFGHSALNPNQALFHMYVPETFVPNDFANPSIQVKLSLYRLGN